MMNAAVIKTKSEQIYNQPFCVPSPPTDPHVNGLFTDDSKMAAYLDRVLKPIAAALKDESALLSYEIINEPEGLMQTGRCNMSPFGINNILSGNMPSFKLFIRLISL